MNEIYDIFSWEWSKIIQSVASIVTALCACIALNIWKQKAQANTKNEFIDTFIDEVHKFILLVQLAIDSYKLIKVSVDIHNDTDKLNPINNKPLPPYKSYIIQNGDKDGKTLFNKLEKCIDSVSKINSLVAKGQIYGFIDYAKCQNSSELIIWQYYRLKDVVNIISNQSLFFENQKIQDTLAKVLSQSPEDMEKYLKEQNIVLLEFAKKNHEKIYK